MFNSVIRQYAQGWLELEKAQVGGVPRLQRQTNNSRKQGEPMGWRISCAFLIQFAYTLVMTSLGLQLGGGAVQHT